MLPDTKEKVQLVNLPLSGKFVKKEYSNTAEEKTMNNNKLFFILCFSLTIIFCHVSFGQIVYPDDIADEGGIEPLDFSRVGVSGWQFLKLPTSARHAASALTNPASLADIEGMQVYTSRMNYVADINYQTASVVKNFGNVGIIGIHLIYLDYGDQIRTENVRTIGGSGIIMDIQYEGLGTFSCNDLAFGLSYARQITNKLQVGASAKFLQQTLDDAKMTGFSFDIGTTYYTGIKSLRFAMLARNLGPDTYYNDYEGRIGYAAYPTRLPSVFAFGAAIDVLDKEGSPHLWTLASEFTRPNDGEAKINFGTEYTFLDMAVLRAGYRYNYDEEDLTLGGGLKLSSGSYSLSLDYAFVKYGRLGDVNIITLGIGF